MEALTGFDVVPVNTDLVLDAQERARVEKLSWFDALIDDPATAPVDDRLRLVLAYVAKLNTLPSRLVQADAQAVHDAGWSEAALFEAVQVCALFNMMNRIVEGTGVNFDYATTPGGHPAAGSTPEAQADTYSRFGAIVAEMAKERR